MNIFSIDESLRHCFGCCKLWRGAAMVMTLVAIPAMAADPDSLAVDTMVYDMEGVTIAAQRKLVKNDIDKLTYDVAGDVTVQTKNTLDMLRSVPLVTVDGQENIKIKGSTAFKVYRNGHPDPTLSGQNMKEVLKAIPASQIKKVEVITDPGAKEDAEGTQYVLNIVMKDNANMNGVTGSLYSQYNFSLKSPTIGGMITAQKGKLATSLSYGYSRQEQDQGNDISTYYVKSGNLLTQRHRENVGVNIHYGDFNASYEVDSLNLLSANFGGYYLDINVSNVPVYFNMTNNGLPVYSYRSIASYPQHNYYDLHGRLDYQHKTRLEGEVLTASYQLQTTRSHQNCIQRYEDELNMPVSYTGNGNDNRQRFMEHTFQLDYVRPMGKVFKWNAGAKYILRQNRSDAWLTYTGAEEMNQHALFNHDTQVGAAYMEGIYSGPKLQARAGLRYEYSYLQAKYPDGSQANFDKRLSDWVPSASLRWSMTETQSVKFSFATNISRPGISYLNPAQVQQPFSLSYGNPGLNSSHNYRFSLEYNYITTKTSLMGGVSTNFSNDGITALNFDQDGISVSTYGDLLHSHSLMLWAYIQTSLWKGATLSGGPNVWKSTYKDSSTGLRMSRWASYNNLNFTQKFPWKLIFNFNGGINIGHEAESVYAYGSPSHWWSASLSRTFLKEDRLNVSVSVSNLIGPHYTSYPSYTVQGDFRGSDAWVGEQKGVRISVSWRFGSLKGGVKKTEHTIENTDLVGGISSGTGQK